MRLLFYTATAFFIVLAGVFIFYAVDGPEQAGGSKIVLSIDSRAAPGGTTPSASEPERDLYAEAASRLKGLDGDKPQAASETETTAASDEPDPNGERIGGTPEQQDVASAEHRDAASSGTAETEGLPPAAEALSGQDSPLPPGTSLAGLDQDRPLFKTIERSDSSPSDPNEPAATSAKTAALPATQLSAPRAANDAPPAAKDERQASGDSDPGAGVNDHADRQDADNAAAGGAASNTTGLRLRQDSASESGTAPTEGGRKADVDAILASLNERDAPVDPAASAAAPAGPPPPLPLRRPDPKTASLNGWGSTKITKATAAAADAKPARIAILLRGVGRDERNSSDAVTKLPPAISLAFMPYSGAAQPWAKKAAEQGHEVIVQLPLEPSDYPVNNPGPETLLASSAPYENASRLGVVLGRFEGYTGVTNFLGGRLLQSKAALRPILEDIKARGLIYIGEGNKSHAVVRGIAGEIGLRYGGADVLIDAQPAPAAIKAALDKLVGIARKEGSAIGMGYASRATIEQLEAWSQTLGEDGITLVPVGTLAHAPGAS